MKRKALLALGFVVCTILVTAGATFALFNASAGPADANFTAARLALSSTRDDGDTAPGPCFYVTAAQGQTPSGVPGHLPTGVWAPGNAHNRTLVVSNSAPASSLDAWLTQVRATLRPGSDAALADKLYVVITTPQAASPYDYVTVAEGTLTEFLAGKALAYPGGGKVPCWLDGTRPLKFAVSFASDADNTYQGLSLVVDFTVVAEQMVHNP